MNLKGLSYEYRAIHLLNNGGEQKSEAYRSLNPSGQVPSLVHDGRVIGQSIAIIDYLDHVKPNPRLFPAESYRRALVMQACEIVNSGTQPLHNLVVLQQLEKSFGASEDQKQEWSRYWIGAGLTALETFLKPHARDYCFGNEVTAADCYLIPQLGNADRVKLPLDKFPTLVRIRAACEALDAFQKAGPTVQPDSPPN